MINKGLHSEKIWNAYNDRFNPDEEYLGRDKEINKKNPLVSVCVPTYNHEHLIEECLDSILAQETDFIFEILVGEDESQDNTRTIVKKYADRHPDKIRLFLRDYKTSHFYDEHGNNVFKFNQKWLRKSARGEFIALCDGDDFWVDHQKLKKQVNFLQSNTDFSLCFHNAKIIYSPENRTQIFSNIEEGEYTGLDIYDKWLIPTSSAVFRTEYIRNSKHAFSENFMFGDLIVFLTLAERGRIWYIDEVMSVYRRHEGGILHNLFSEPANLRRFAVHQKEIIKTFSADYEKVSQRKLSWIYFLLFKTTFKSNFFGSFYSLFKSIYHSTSMSTHLLFNLLRTRLNS